MGRWVVFGLRWKYLSCFPSLLSSPILSVYRPPLLPLAQLLRVFGSRSSQCSRCPSAVPGAQSWRDGAFMPCATSRSTGLFWQGLQQWMGIITVSLQRELAEMKAVFNVQRSPCNYLRARDREREKERQRGIERERERRWSEPRWESRKTSIEVLHLERLGEERAAGFSFGKEFTGWGTKWITKYFEKSGWGGGLFVMARSQQDRTCLQLNVCGAQNRKFKSKQINWNNTFFPKKQN